ncbi:MAG TPA: DUF1631 family protein [Rhodanobacter sp.]
MEADQDRHRSVASISRLRLGDGRWPARAQRLLEDGYAACTKGLHEPLQRCLGEFGQALFALAERARQPAEQQDLFASRQRVLQDHAGFEQRLMELIGTAFNDLGIDKAATDASQKSWKSLELLDPAEQELGMAVDQLGARGDVRHSSVLYELGYRFAVLIGAPPLENGMLPVGPHALATAFHQASAPLDLPKGQQLLLLQYFEALLQRLGPMYDEINAQLQADGILPRLRSLTVPRGIVRRARAAVVTDDETTAEESGRQPAGPTGRASGNAAAGDSIAVLESLRDLLAQQRASQGGALGPLGGRAASTDELQAALSALQQHLAQVTDHASRELRSAQRLREELLTQLNVNKPTGAPRTQLSGEQGDTVELVAMLFEQLGLQLQQGSNAQALLGDLQLPVLRMAVTDRGFFEQREHPARRLLDTVTAAANDWLDGSDDESNRPLAAKLEQLVNRARQEPPSAGLYTTLLADIEHHLAMLSRKAQAAERRHVEAAKGRERLDQARHRTSELMSARFAQSPPRGLLRALLDRAWSDVLALTLLRHGEDSATFAAQLAITDQLLGHLPISDAQRLQQDVEAGLQQIGMHAEEALQVAQRLLGTGTPDSAQGQPSTTDLAIRLKQHQRFGEQQSTQESATTASPSAKPEALAAEAPAKPPTTTPAKPAITEPLPEPAAPYEVALPPSVPAATVIVPTSPAVKAKSAKPATPVTRDASPRERKIEQHLRELPFGSWFAFVDKGTGQTLQRKLAWYSPMSGRCLLVSRRGQRGEEMTLAQLAQEIAAGRASEVSQQRESLLDRAWRGLTRNLRQATDPLRPPVPEPYRP